MDTTIIWQILLQLILIALNAVFACAEIAVISMNDNKLAQMAGQGDKRALRLVYLTNQPARFLATIQVAITLAGSLGSAFAADNFSDIIVEWLVSLGVSIPVSVLNSISVIAITIILAYFTLVFGELVPKRIAMKKAEQLALGLSALVYFIAKVSAPVVWALTASTNFILKLVGIDPNSDEDKVSEEEILMMIDIGSQKGVIDFDEKEMIQNVFEFDDLSVGEFATHRTDVVIIWMDESVEEWDNTISESRHSLYPVCNESVDDVTGILSAKDYYRIKDKTRENVLKNAIKPAYFIPESTRADILFRQMKHSKNYFAVVIDEYGGMLGIVTMNDLLEQLVGDLDDDINDSPDFVKLDAKSWQIRGSASLDDVQKMLGIPLPIEDYDTFGGFVFGSYGSIPDDGTTFDIDIDSMHIKVLEIKDHRIEKAMVILNHNIDGNNSQTDEK